MKQLLTNKLFWLSVLTTLLIASSVVLNHVKPYSNIEIIFTYIQGASAILIGSFVFVVLIFAWIINPIRDWKNRFKN